MATTEPLTEREQQAPEHMRKAQELGSTLKGYAAKCGLDVQQLYELRKRLVRKGAFGPPPRRRAKEPDKADAFLPVRVVPAAPVPSSRSVTCRLAHPSGWVLECDGFPPACWMAAIWAGGAHAAA